MMLQSQVRDRLTAQAPLSSAGCSTSSVGPAEVRAHLTEIRKLSWHCPHWPNDVGFGPEHPPVAECLPRWRRLFRTIVNARTTRRRSDGMQP